jgi:hypothetical protein
MTFNHDRLFSKGFRQDSAFYMKVFSKHGNGVSMLHKAKINRRIGAEQSEFDVKNGSTLKYSWDMYAAKYKLSNGAAMFELKAKPQDLNTSDLAFEAKNSTNFKTEGAAWDNTTSVKCGLPPTGPVRLWASMDFVFKMGGARIIKNSFNAQMMDHFFLGAKTQHDTQKLTALEAQLTHKEGDQLQWLRWNNFSQHATAGFSHFCGDCDTTGFGELDWDKNGKQKTCCGLPVTAKAGISTKVNDTYSLKMVLKCNQHCTLDGSWLVKFSDHMKVLYSDSLTLPCCGDKFNLKMGLAFQFAF